MNKYNDLEKVATKELAKVLPKMIIGSVKTIEIDFIKYKIERTEEHSFHLSITKTHDLDNAIKIIRQVNKDVYNKNESTKAILDELISPMLIKSDAPDGYSIAENGTVYIFEHFLIDGFPKKKGSSTLMENIAYANKNRSDDISEDLEPNSKLEYLKSNFKRAFNKHSNQINNYKKNIISKLGYEPCFKIIFVATVLDWINTLDSEILDSLKLKGVDNLIVIQSTLPQINGGEVLDNNCFCIMGHNEIINFYSLNEFNKINLLN